MIRRKPHLGRDRGGKQPQNCRSPAADGGSLVCRSGAAPAPQFWQLLSGADMGVLQPRQQRRFVRDFRINRIDIKNNSASCGHHQPRRNTAKDNRNSASAMRNLFKMAARNAASDQPGSSLSSVRRSMEQSQLGQLDPGHRLQVVHFAQLDRLAIDIHQHLVHGGLVTSSPPAAPDIC